jgi:hypothetical protein
MGIGKSKFFAQFIAGIFGGTILGIAGFLIMLTYGGNYGCWSFIDSLFGTAGYESCGLFGGITGIIVGVIVGIFVFSKVKVLSYLKAGIYMLLASFILPFLYGVIMFWPPFEDGDLFIVPPVVGGFMLASVIPSGIAALAANYRKFLNK